MESNGEGSERICAKSSLAGLASIMGALSSGTRYDLLCTSLLLSESLFPAAMRMSTDTFITSA